MPITWLPKPPFFSPQPFVTKVRAIKLSSQVSQPGTTWKDAFLRPNFKALLVDAAGTLLSPSEPAAHVYLRYCRRHGVSLGLGAGEVLARYRDAYARPWANSTLRYVGDGRPFWRTIVAHATGSDNQELFEDIYMYYARAEAWTVSPGAVESLQRIRNNLPMKTAVVSNFDTRLRPILRELNIDHVFDAIIVSAEVGAEKPNPVIFEAAFKALDVAPEEAIHVGDDRRNDLFGARAAGCFAWVWGADVHNFAEVERRLETGNVLDSLSGREGKGTTILWYPVNFQANLARSQSSGTCSMQHLRG